MTGQKSLRKAIWNDADTGEAYRDLDGRIRAMSVFDVRVLPNTVYAPPIIIDTGGITPAAVHMGTVRVPGTPTNLQPTITPLWDMFGGKLRINSIGGATVGTRYDITFLIFYEAT